MISTTLLRLPCAPAIPATPVRLPDMRVTRRIWKAMVSVEKTVVAREKVYDAMLRGVVTLSG